RLRSALRGNNDDLRLRRRVERVVRHKLEPTRARNVLSLFRHGIQLKRHLLVHAAATPGYMHVLKDFPWSSEVDHGDALRDGKCDRDLSFCRWREFCAHGDCQCAVRQKSSGKRVRNAGGGCHDAEATHKFSSFHNFLRLVASWRRSLMLTGNARS